MIYIKEHNSLFNSPEVKEPLLGTFIKRIEFDKRFAAYQQWRLSEAKIIGEHSFVEGIDYQENVDFGLIKQILVNTNSVDEWLKASDSTYEYYPVKHKRIVAIPIKAIPEKKDEDLEPGKGNPQPSDSVASHSVCGNKSIRQFIKEQGIYQPFLYINNKRYDIRWLIQEYFNGRWINGMPDYDGDYLCHVQRKNECGTISDYQRVVNCRFNKWILNDERECIIKFMHLPLLTEQTNNK